MSTTGRIPRRSCWTSSAWNRITSWTLSDEEKKQNRRLPPSQIGEVLAEKEKPFQIRFDGPPGPKSGRFVEAENLDGQGISKGRWVQDGEYWLLIVD